jgi:hypothetical protein
MDLVRFQFESGIVSFCFPLILFHLENRVCLSRGVQVAGVAWRVAMRIISGVGDLVQRTGMVAQVGYSVTERSRDRVAPCAACTVHVETTSTSFLVEPQIQGRWFVSGLASKPLGRFLSVWPQTRW